MKLSSMRVPKCDGGVWVELPEFPGVSVCIKPADDIEYRRASTNGYQPHQKTLRTGRLLDPAAVDRIVARAAAKALITDWKGIDGEDGNPLPFSREQAAALAEDPEYTRFFRAVEREAELLATAGAEERAELGKS